jgi:hypothetical protein
MKIRSNEGITKNPVELLHHTTYGGESQYHSGFISSFTSLGLTDEISHLKEALYSGDY